MSGAVWISDRPDGMIPPDDRGFLLADSVFETVRLVEGTLRHWPAHMNRLRSGAAVMGMPVLLEDEEIAARAMVLVAQAGLRDGALRVTLTRGTGPRGLAPPEPAAPRLVIAVHAGAYGTAPLDVIVGRVTRVNEHSPLSRIKSTASYADAVLARREALIQGADDALMVNTAGRLARATAATVLVTVGDRTVTPPVEDGALPGITRARLLAVGLVEEASITPEMLDEAQAVLLVNALSARPVRRLDGKLLNAPLVDLMQIARDNA